MAKAPTVRCEFIFWDWEEQPDFTAIEASANWMLSHGATRVHLTLAGDTDDSYCLVVSDSDLSPAEATRAYNDFEDAIPPDQGNQLTIHRLFGAGTDPAVST